MKRRTSLWPCVKRYGFFVGFVVWATCRWQGCRTEAVGGGINYPFPRQCAAVAIKSKQRCVRCGHILVCDVVLERNAITGEITGWSPDGRVSIHLSDE